MLRDRDPGDETAHVPDFDFYTGAPVRIGQAASYTIRPHALLPATIDDREADYGRPHSVEDAFALPPLNMLWPASASDCERAEAGSRDCAVFVGPWGAFPA